ncbi:hypothetical protein NQ315_017112 [Exocentrus adspersus]|uniref:Uncharacterized protein n=1 Tax=Exocentrus adspersus TaxID=1586481 RepID=A0AAV8VGN6_9CUCU|nr:hypothetical protein NQ315_017112 [Exocentrus adspersus]
MWRYLCVLLYLDGAFASYSPSYFCADMNPQPTVIIPQLMGMWYGVEKIDHQDERHYSRSAPSCPIIHLSEDHPATTTNPLYRNRQYYGYGDQNYATGTGTPPYGGKTQEQINREMRERMEYDRRTTYRDHPARKIYNQDYINNYNNNNYYNQIGLAEEHYLRMYWDENGENTEFHLRYNVTRKGFWISSGPENGAPLKSQFGHFAGTVQVLKAVGNHMVLTICHQVPTRQLYSIILSREPKLGPVEIHSIHRMLNRKGVNTNAVMKLCNNDGTRMAGISLSVLLLIQLFVYGILNK